MSRLSKRLAGPAFYINVKFDQATALKHKQKSSATYQGNTRQYYHVVNENELFDIKEGEILYCENSSARDGFARVLSSLNGVGTVNMSKMKFIGIAQTEHKYDKKVNIEQGLVACVSGVVTVLNESNSTIHPGDLLVLAEPHQGAKQYGIHPQKMRFAFKRAEPAKHVNTIIDDIFARTLTEPEKAAALKAELEENKPNYIAKALSYAKKGERLDILLHPRQT